MTICKEQSTKINKPQKNQNINKPQKNQKINKPQKQQKNKYQKDPKGHLR
jgi:hypothetical protein